MKKIFSLILLVVSLNGLAQFPMTQGMATSNTRLQVNGAVDARKGLINGIYTDTTSANADQIDFYDGAQIWTTSDRNLWLRSSVLNMWIRMARFSEVGGGSRFGVSGEDDRADADRYFSSGGNGFTHDSIGAYRVNFDASAGLLFQTYNSSIDRFRINNSLSGLYSPNATNFLDINDGRGAIVVGSGDSILLSSTSGIVSIPNIPYNASAGIVHLGLDTVAGSPTFNRLVRKTAGSGSTPTLQQVTTAGSSSNVSIELTGEDGSDGHALSLVNAYLPLLIQNNFDPSTTAAVDGIMMIRANNAGNGINNQALRITYVNENGSGTQFATGYTEHILTDATAGSLDVHYNIGGVENSVSKTFMNIQTAGIVRVNDNADTLATKAYARSVGGGGGGSGTVTSVSFTDDDYFDGSVANATTTPAISLVTKNALFNPFDLVTNFGFSDQPLIRQSSFGSGSTIGTLNVSTIFDGWMYGQYMETGTTTTGSAYNYGYSSGQVAGIAISNSFRYNAGCVVRLDVLSDGTDTYNYMFGFGDDAGNGVSAITDGIYFEYTHSLNSGNWTFTTESNGTKTQTDTGIPVVADTDYKLNVSVYNGNAFGYINNTLVATNTTNIPTGTARATSIANAIAKTAGTTNVKAFVEYIGWGKRPN